MPEALLGSHRCSLVTLLRGSCASETRGRSDVVAAMDNLFASNSDEHHGLGFARLEAHSGTCGNVELLKEGLGAVKQELWVDFDEVVVRSDLDGSVAHVGHAQLDTLSARVDGNGGRTGKDLDLAWLIAGGSKLVLDGRKSRSGWLWKE